MFPFFDMNHLRHIRIMGVLARIAVCYLFAGTIYLVTIRARMARVL